MKDGSAGSTSREQGLGAAIDMLGPSLLLLQGHFKEVLENETKGQV